MKKLIWVFVFCVLGTGCASTSIAIPEKIEISEIKKDGRFGANYSRIETLHNELSGMAKDLNNESRALNTLTVTAGAATLAFAGFDAHPDNTIASTLVAGISGATANQLKPGQRAAFRVKGMLALRCIQSKADAFLDVDAQGVRAVNSALLSGAIQEVYVIKTLVASTGVFSNSEEYIGPYYVLDDILFLMLNEATSLSGEEIKTAMMKAGAARTKLALGIKADREAFGAMSDAISVVEQAIYSEEAPSIQGLMEAIAKIEFPDAAAAPSEGGNGAGLAGSPDPEEIVRAMEYLSGVAESLSAQMELKATYVKGMTACAAGMAQ